MMPLTDLIPFGEWMPDQPPLSGAARNIENVLCNGQYYRPLPGVSNYSGSLADPCVGAGSFLVSNGTVVTIAGTADNLYRLTGTTWEDVTRTSGGDYTTSQENKWRFVQYGDRIIGTNYDDVIQTLLVGADTDFSALGGSPPRAKHIAVLNNFIMIGNTDNANNEVAWSGLDSPTTWGTNIQLQADSQLIENEGGEVRGIFGSQNYGVILQQKAITRVEYVGPPEIFRFVDAEKGRGALTHYGNASLGTMVYYLSEDGFYRFDGTNSINISENRVTRWFFSTVDENYLFNVTCAIDPINTIAIWGFADVNATGGRPNRLLIYDWTDNRWSNARIEHEFVYRALSTGYTLDQLDTVEPVLEDLPFSLDSSVWKGGLTNLAFFSDSSSLAFLTSDPLEATLETTETRINPQGRAFISSVFPQVDAAGVTVQVAHRNLPTDSLTYSSAITVNSYNGQADFRIDNRFHRGIVTIPAGASWNDAMGVQIDFTPTGNN
jgi:hypothetical protein